MNQIILVFILGLSLAGCASWEKSTLAYMGGAMAGGLVIGAAQAPDGDDKAMHGLLWGSLAAATVGAALVYSRDENETIREREIEIKSLKDQLSASKLRLNGGDSQFLERELPGELQGLIEPGKWSLYEIDEWKQTKKGEYVHQDRILEVRPAKMKITK